MEREVYKFYLGEAIRQRKAQEQQRTCARPEHIYTGLSRLSSTEVVRFDNDKSLEVNHEMFHILIHYSRGIFHRKLFSTMRSIRECHLSHP